MSIQRGRLPVLCGTAVAAVAAGLMAGSPAAVAAPTIPGGTLSVTCPGLGTFDVVTPPTGENASFSPAFSTATHQVFVPYDISGTITSGGESFPFHDVKKAPVPTNAMTCTFAGTFGEGEFTVTITGTAVVVQRGAPG